MARVLNVAAPSRGRRCRFVCLTAFPYCPVTTHPLLLLVIMMIMMLVVQEQPSLAHDQQPVRFVGAPRAPRITARYCHGAHGAWHARP